MFQQYLANKRYITREVIAAEFDDDLMQDAMAVVLFRCPQDSIVQSSHKRDPQPVGDLLKLWPKSKLPNPLKDGDDDMLSQVDKLHTQLLILIEDYVTKATASFPPQEYICLPPIQSSLAGGHLAFRGIKGSSRFNSARLTSLERRRFVKAFLEYEILCQTCRLDISFNSLEQSIITQTEREAISCVQQYFGSLYGAIFAQCNDDWLPGTSTGALPESKLLHPDNFWFEADAYAPDQKDLDIGSIVDNFLGNDYAGTFSTFGLDHLKDFLRYDMARSNEREALRLKVQQFCDSDYGPLAVDVYVKLSFTIDRIEDHGPESFMYEQVSVDMSSKLRRNVCQQRAWVFFDNDRFYPEDSTERPNFPSEAFLQNEVSKQAENRIRFYGLKQMRSLQRRSGEKKVVDNI
ncbi:hypothetical protein FHETE_7427 [Fusarium heterosporum]|uniref:Uncharacterized protein n=1 Tax=Fusarium heterosporum TaxID=42747 RepID=A0A8H5WI93_FUSHE|nr:hypothetical protein FHETE_7427 [Fusarium heterosporum]